MLFAAITRMEGRTFADCLPRHRHQEWTGFLKKNDTETPADLDRKWIIDNNATYKDSKVMSPPRRHAQNHPYFAPASGSWLEGIECWF
jgi:putative transposase